MNSQPCLRRDPLQLPSKLKLVSRPLLFERFDEIAFNAGMLDKSVILKTADYLRIAQPELVISAALRN